MILVGDVWYMRLFCVLGSFFLVDSCESFF